MTDERVIDLLMQWEDLRTQGRDVAVEELCAACPELAEEVRHQIHRLHHVDRALDLKPNCQEADHAERTIRANPEYEVLEELGRGGMGIVYKARQVKLNRLVALKQLREGDLADREQLARFRTEAEAMARLQHPHIVQIHEVGEYDGRPYCVCEFVDGGSLARQLAGTPLHAEEAARLVETLARAVHAAHQQGIVHRDLKPSNVLLTRAGVPKLTDFGLAKRLDVPSGWTRSGAVMGTPSYMAPEQAEGRTRAIGPATDVYGLGAVLYECLTGRPPFQGPTALDTLEQVRSAAPVPPSRLQPRVTPALEKICLQCLEKDPRRRYATAEALADDLGRWLLGETHRDFPAGTTARSWVSFLHAARRPRLRVILAVAAVLAVATLVLAWRYFPTRTAGPGGNLDVQVYRADKIFDLASALPLRSGDKVQIACDVPRGSRAALFFFDSEGQLTELTPVAVTPHDGCDRVSYPMDGIAPVVGPAGTEMVLVCARRTQPVDAGDLASCFEPGTRWPALPAYVVVRLHRDRVEVDRVRALAAPEEDAVRAVRERVEQLRQRLHERYEFLAGVAFSHQNAE